VSAAPRAALTPASSASLAASPTAEPSSVGDGMSSSAEERSGSDGRPTSPGPARAIRAWRPTAATCAAGGLGAERAASDWR
jgi:hypothetical protein